MKQFSRVKKLTFSAILIALGVLIPMVMPVKIIIGPVTFTLASHVPIFLAMFISPSVAVAVALGTAFGFFISMPFVVAVRALSHIVFATFGAYILKKMPGIVNSPRKNLIFNIVIGVIHAIVEALVILVLFMTKSIKDIEYTSGFLTYTLLIMVIGGLIHSIVDYYLAFYVAKRTERLFPLPVFTAAKSLVKK